MTTTIEDVVFVWFLYKADTRPSVKFRSLKKFSTASSKLIPMMFDPTHDPIPCQLVLPQSLTNIPFLNTPPPAVLLYLSKQMENLRFYECISNGAITLLRMEGGEHYLKRSPELFFDRDQ